MQRKMAINVAFETQQDLHQIGHQWPQILLEELVEVQNGRIIIFSSESFDVTCGLAEAYIPVRARFNLPSPIHHIYNS